MVGNTSSKLALGIKRLDTQPHGSALRTTSCSSSFDIDTVYTAMESKDNQAAATRDVNPVQANREKQCNPTHEPTGPGRNSGYAGDGSKADLNNHSEQLNSNNYKFLPKK